jgi:hypothetical protein
MYAAPYVPDLNESCVTYGRAYFALASDNNCAANYQVTQRWLIIHARPYTKTCTRSCPVVLRCGLLKTSVPSVVSTVKSLSPYSAALASNVGCNCVGPIRSVRCPSRPIAIIQPGTISASYIMIGSHKTKRTTVSPNSTSQFKGGCALTAHVKI